MENILDNISLDEVIEHFGEEAIAEKLSVEDKLSSVTTFEAANYYGNSILNEFEDYDILDNFDIKELILSYGDKEKIADILSNNDVDDFNKVKNKIKELCRLQSPYRFLDKKTVKEILNEMVDFYFF